MDIIDLINEYFSLQCFYMVSSFAPHYLYTTFIDEGGNYSKQVSKGDSQVEVWIALL
jgi:hypothetical protein